MNKNLALAVARIFVFVLFGALLALSVPAQGASQGQEQGQEQFTPEDEGEANIPTLEVDEDNGTYIVYPANLPACDEEDGTGTVDGIPVDACFWDAKGSGTSFVVVAR